MSHHKYQIGQIISGVGGNSTMGEITGINITRDGEDKIRVLYTVLANDRTAYILEENALLLVFDVDVKLNAEAR